MEDGSGKAGPAGELEAFSPFHDSEDDRPPRKRGVGAISSSLKGPDLRAAIRTALGPDEPPGDIKKFISAECDKLSAKVLRSLNLHAKIAKLKQQVTDLFTGKVPPGVKPFKASVEIAELDQVIPEEMCNWSLTVERDTTYRQLKEKLHYAQIGFAKRVDAELMGLQVGNLRNEISLDTFVACVSAKVTHKSTIVNELYQQLGLGVTGAPNEQLAISACRAEKLYADVMQSVAEFQQKEKLRASEQDASLAKTIEKLKGTTPKDLLKQTIDSSIGDALKAKGLGKNARKSSNGPSVDLAQAYEIATKGFDDFSEAVTFDVPPTKGSGKAGKSGKGKGKSPKKDKGKGGKSKDKSSTVFRDGKKPKVKHRDQGWGKGKGKKGDKPGKGKSRKGKGKGRKGW